MNRYKYIILFLAFLFFRANNTFGQYHIKTFVEGVVPIKTPISNGVKDYSVGIESNIQFSRMIRERNELFMTSSILYIPGKRTDDKYLRYKQTPIVSFPVKLGYGYRLGDNLSLTLAAGPTFFTKPDEVTGVVLALGLYYSWHKFSLGVGLQRINYHGHMDLFKFGLGYQIF